MADALETAAERLAIRINTAVNAYLTADGLSPTDAIAVLVEVTRHIGNEYGCAEEGKDVLRNAVRSDWSQSYRHLGAVKALDLFCGAGGSERREAEKRKFEAERAVIDAAEALLEELRGTRRYAIGEMTEAECDIMHTVNALREARGE